MSNILVDKTILEKKLKELESQLSSMIKKHSSELNEQKKGCTTKLLYFQINKIIISWCVVLLGSPIKWRVQFNAKS